MCNYQFARIEQRPASVRGKMQIRQIAEGGKPCIGK